MGGRRALSLQTQLVLAVLLEDPSVELYGLDICRRAGMASGTIYPILARLERDRWLESRWEDIDPRTEGRSARRYYRLTASGTSQACQLLAETHARLRAVKTRSPFLTPGPVAE